MDQLELPGVLLRRLPLVSVARDHGMTGALTRQLASPPAWPSLALDPGRIPPIVLYTDRPTVLGSAADADIRLPDPYVSAHHATIRLDSRGFCIEDLRSTNGTFVDGVRVERAWLVPGTLIRLGTARLTTVRGNCGPAKRPQPSHPLVGASRPILQLRRTLERLAPLRHPVLLHGETGTGKELAARQLHDLGPRSDRPFVALNCAAIPEGLAESELFGHVRGAFTGAHRARAGAFGRAHGGTLFLDEVGELAPALQAKLLRALETRRVVPVGSEREVEVDVRIVSATHRDLEALSGFREDLYHRLTVLFVQIPPLRERPDDIPLLLAHFVREAGNELGVPISLSGAAVNAARSHRWPGNVRELRNAVVRAAALADGPIAARDLIPSSRARFCGARTITIELTDFESMRRAVLETVLAEHGSIRQAAEALHVPRSTLGAWCQRLRIDVAQLRTTPSANKFQAASR